MILPNLSYIGGGGEIAYWLQLKKNFDHYGVPFPSLLLRNSALIYSDKLKRKMDKLNLTHLDLFSKRNIWIDKKNVNREVHKPIVFCKSLFVSGTKNNRIIPKRGNPINVNKIEESNIQLVT